MLCVIDLCLGGYTWELARVLGVYLGRVWSCILYWVHQRRRLVFAIDVLIANQVSMFSRECVIVNVYMCVCVLVYARCNYGPSLAIIP